MTTRLNPSLTGRRVSPKRGRAGAPQSEAKAGATPHRWAKVVDLDDLQDRVSQLRDDLDRWLELVNDSFVTASVPTTPPPKLSFEEDPEEGDLWHGQDDE